MKHTLILLLAAFVLSFSLIGCKDDEPAATQTETPSLELAEEQEEVPVPSEDDLNTELPKETEENKQPETPSDKIPEESTTIEHKPSVPSVSQKEEPEKEKNPSPVRKDLPFSQELMTRPAEELKNNPQKLDERLYSVFANVMEQNFDRQEGQLTVHRLNADGTQDAFELTFDLSNSFDEHGNFNRNRPIEARMKAAKTFQSNYNYGSGDTVESESYDDYEKTIEEFKSPLLSSGFVLKNFSDLTLTEEDGQYLILAVFRPQALQKMFNQEIYGTVQAYVQLDADGNVEELGWEQWESEDDSVFLTSFTRFWFS